MVAALLVFGMIFAFYGFAFGFTRLLLRGSAWEQYSLEAPLLTGPALVVLALTLLGYRLPSEVPPWQAWALLLAGGLASALVLLRDRRELLALLRANRARLATVLLAACCAAAALLVYFSGSAWDEFPTYGTGEYLNYAQQAAALTGHHLGPQGRVSDGFAFVRVWRDGQDLVLAAVAQLTRLHPARAVLPVAVLFRFQHSAALGLLVCGLAGGPRKYGLVLVVLLLEAALLFEVMAFRLSFFSSNCIMPLCAIYFVLLATQPQFGAREVGILVLLNLFFLMTYPEWLFVVKGLEAVAVLAAVVGRRRRYWLPLLACNLLLVAAHPLLVWKKLEVIWMLATTNDGFSVLGSPRTPLHYLGNLFGLGTGGASPGELSRKHPWLQGVVLAAAAAVTVLGVATLLRQRRFTLPVLTWLALLAAGHLFPVLKHAGGNWYVSYKILAQTYFVIILAAAALLVVPASRWRYAGLLLVTVWLAGAGYAWYRFVPAIGRWGEVLVYAALRDGVRAAPGPAAVASACRTREPLWMLGLISGETGATVVVLTDAQQQQMLGSIVGTVRPAGPPAGALRYEGLVVVDGKQPRSGPVWLEDRVALDFECQDVVAGAGTVTLCRGRLSLPWGVTLPAGRGVTPERAGVPPLWARSGRLRLTGELPPGQPLPYHITCAVSPLDWTGDVELDHSGPFSVTLDLPAGAAGREVALSFSPRDLGFLLTRVEFLAPASP
jgi:hypothetical protein